MAFSTKTSQLKKVDEQSSIEQIEIYKASLLADISDFAIEFENLQNQVIEAQKKDIGIENKTKLLNDLEDKAKELQLFIAELSKKKEVLEKDIVSINELQKTENDLKILIQSMNESVESIKKEIESLNTQYDISSKRLEDIISKIQIQNDKLLQLILEYHNKEAELESEFQKNKTFKDLELHNIDNYISTKKITLEDIDSKITEKENILSGINKNIDSQTVVLNSIDQIISEKLTESQKEINIQLDSLKKQENDFANRDGILSLREAKLAKDRKNLSTIKMKLEQEIGSPINIEI